MTDGTQPSSDPAGPVEPSPDGALPRFDAEYGDGARPFRREPRPPLTRRLLPLVAELRGYRVGWLRGDAIAGLVVGAVAIPQALGYAQIAGVPPVSGLYALTVPVVVFALFTSTRLLAVGPTTTAALLVPAAVSPLADGDSARYVALATVLALMTGAVLVGAGLLRLGWVADYLSAAVLTGFLTGLAVTLIIGQLDELLGLPGTSGNALQQLVEIVTSLTAADGPTVVVMLVTLGLLALGSQFAPRLPTILVVAVLGIVVSWAADLEAAGVAVVGALPSGLPAFAVPTVPLTDLLILVPAAGGIAIVAFSDAILTARGFAGRHNETVNANQELVALGGLNIAAGLFQGFPVGSSGSRTAVAERSGGRTQVSALVLAAFVVVVLLFLTEPIGYLPQSVLGAIIVFAALGLVDRSAWRGLWRGPRAELTIAAVTTVGMLTVGLLPALGLAVLLSVADVARRSAQPHDALLGWSPSAGRFVNVSNHPSARLIPGVVVYRLDDRLFFANSQYFRERVRAAIAAAPYDVHRFVFDAEGVTHLDGSGAEALETLVSQLADDGVTFVVARLKHRTRETFDQFGLVAAIGVDNFFPTVRQAVFVDETPPTA
ncbi:MAG: SulP family inorganic anion transporter [Actinomycetota bacterium]|nr:SulP family inorganic anion transporter [Actinomycetota bacterium]